MNHKIKSVVYFASFVAIVVLYLNTKNTNSVQNNDIVTTTIEDVSSAEALT